VNGDVLHRIARAASEEHESRDLRAQRTAEIIRETGEYRWVGIYDVADGEVSLIAYAGSGAPAHEQFPVTQGLTAAAVQSRAPVIVGDVREDKRYLTAFATTRSEAIVPVLGAESGIVIGTLDVESDRLDAFDTGDTAFLEDCAAALMPLYE
jgi:L-methionine (R)-S-oxide reductase